MPVGGAPGGGSTAGFATPGGYSFSPGGAGPGGVPNLSASGGGAGGLVPSLWAPDKFAKRLPCGRIRVSPDSGLGYIYAYDKVDNIFRIQQYLGKIRNMLHREVLLKVDIAEIDLSKNDQFGVNWNNVFGKLGNMLTLSSPSATVAGLGLGAPAVAGSGIAATASSVSQIPNNYALGIVSGSTNADVLQALSEVTKVHLVNQPRILTISGPAVTINATTSTPYLQSEMPFSAGGLSSATEIIPQIGFVPVGTSLVLSPTIREKENALSLYIAPTLNVLQGFTSISAQGVGTFQEPIVNSRSLSSVINVKSGDTIIFGGLISSTVQKQQWKIPGLGDWFPLLFSGYNNVKQSTEMVVWYFSCVVTRTPIRDPFLIMSKFA